MVILRCITSLNINCYKSYDKRHKNANNTKGAAVCFCTKYHKKKEMEIVAFCVITFEPIITTTCEAPQNDRHKLNFVKDKHIYSET